MAERTNSSRTRTSSRTQPVRGKHAAPESYSRPASGSARASRTRVSKRTEKRGLPKAVKVLILVLIVAVLVAGGFLAWNRWLRYNDAQDIQGQWKVEGTTNSIVITDTEIRLTDSVSFTYELNTFDKTITYRYVSYSGEGAYEFSSDREELMLTDMGASPDEGDTAPATKLLKVSDEAVGEPESANNNTTEDANTYGAEVVDDAMTPDEAKQEDDLPGDADPDAGSEGSD